MAIRVAHLETQKMIENNVWTIDVDYDEKYTHNNINNT